MLFSSQVYAQIQDWETSSCMVDGVPTLKCFEVVFSNILFLSSTFLVFALFVMLVVGAIKYITSLGNPEAVKKAQATMRYAFLGFMLFMASYLILKIIDWMFLGNQNRIFQFKIGD